MTSKEDPGGQFGVRVMTAYVPTVVTAHIAANWLPKHWAMGMSTFAFLLMSYWLPPKSRKKFSLWLLIVASLALLVWILVRLQPDMF